MKKILLFLMTICALASMNTAKAQCDLKIANLVITKKGVATPVGPDCSLTFDASFDIITNSGFKYLFFHSWKAQNYPTPSVFDCTQLNAAQNPGTSLQLGTNRNTFGKSFLDLGFIGLNGVAIGGTPVNVTNYIATVYPHDNSVELVTPANSPSIQAMVSKRGNDTLHFDITDINVLVYGGCVPIETKTDIWGSNANAGDPKAQCFICGLSQIINGPTVTLTKSCETSPFTYTLGILTGPGSSVNAVYKIYADADDDNVKEPGSAQDALLYTSGPLTLDPNTQYTYGPSVLPNPWCCIGPWAQYGIYAIVEVQDVSNGFGTPIANIECATLPIKLKSFNAERSRSNVDVKWETEVEINNKGFYLERKLSNGGWQDITFIASKATNGNSNTALVYNFTDFNNTKGISQYRLRQIDIDGKQAYSLIRSVRGEGQKSNTIIYPNPSGDGKVSIVFEGANSVRDVSLMDVSGKTLKQWKGVTNNNIQIDNLNAGFYTVRIVNVESGEQVVEKFIVNKR
jgi:Secretion system C-terminal sorting domain